MALLNREAIMYLWARTPFLNTLLEEEGLEVFFKASLKIHNVCTYSHQWFYQIANIG